MTYRLRSAAYFGLSVILLIVAAEGILRLFIPLTKEPNYADTIRETALNRERLWAPNLNVEYDIRGLYQGATRTRLRTSARRFIEPEPAGDYRFRVLFLGGSTMEALYVPPEKRWVALLNEPGQIAAFNGADSGANTVDKYYAYLYLTEREGLQFDMVVLATPINDLSWERRLQTAGGHLVIPSYHENLERYYVNSFEDSKTLLQKLSRHSVIFSILNKWHGAPAEKPRAPRQRTGNSAVVLGSVATVYVNAVEDAKTNAGSGRTYELNDVQDEVDRMLEQYRSNARENIGAFVSATAKHHSKLLVLSEATAFDAPTASFELDLRPLPYVLPSKRLLSTKAVAGLFDRMNTTYLEAARSAGADTFDLASEIRKEVEHGGALQYDGVHYTEKGCAKVAEILKPIIESRLR
jgi:lysophospholipase L1-like esterase